MDNIDLDRMKYTNDELRKVIPKIMIQEHVVLVTTKYYITTRAFCVSPGWRTWVYATPKTMNTWNVGWDNVPCGKTPKNWIFIPSGTSTVIYPSGKELKKILQEIKNEILSEHTTMSNFVGCGSIYLCEN